MEQVYQRTDDEILSKAPIKVRFGATDYEIAPLTLGPARKWREGFTGEMKLILESFQSENSHSAVPPALTAALIAFPEKIGDMVFAYAPNLQEQRETILDESTEEQMAFAFGRIMRLAFPYLAHLGTVTQVLRAKLSQ